MNFLPSREYNKYLKPGRLSDVLALIQVLALDPSTYRSETGKKEGKIQGLQGEFQDKPESAETWTKVASEHREFFRVNPDQDNSVSLVARHVTPMNTDGVRELPEAFTGKLMELAIDLHDRQVKHAERWTYLIPILVALLGGLGAIAAAIIQTSGPA